MKSFKKISSVMLLALLSLTSCRPATTSESTGEIRPEASKDVRIRVIANSAFNHDADPIRAEGTNEITYDQAFRPGDMIELLADYKYVTISLFDYMGESIIYSPTGRFLFQVPTPVSSDLNSPLPYEFDKTFDLKNHTIKAHISTDEEISKTRNLALNPYDQPYSNELGTYNVNNDKHLLDSPCLPDSGTDEILAYPHAYANYVTQNKPIFNARNAIDGVVKTGVSETGLSTHYVPGYQSWGYGKVDDAQFTVYFGREVEISSLDFVLRNDTNKTDGKLPHDTYWSEVTAEFSDGSEETISDLQGTNDLQHYDLSSPITTTYVRLKGMKNADNGTSTQGWAALVELQANGKDKATTNEEATHITTDSKSLMGKQIGTTTIDSSNKARDVLDFIKGVFKYTAKDPDYGNKAYGHDDFKRAEAGSIHENCYYRSEHKAKGKNYKITYDPNNHMQKTTATDYTLNYGYQWQDGVMYTGMMDAFITTGDDDILYYLRNLGDSMSWKINAGNNTNHSDDYVMGETFMRMDKLDPSVGGFRSKNAMANADYVIKQNKLDAPASGFGQNTSSSYKTKDNLPAGCMNFWWCDSLYMGLDTFTLMSENKEDPTYVEDAYKGYMYWRDDANKTGKGLPAGYTGGLYNQDVHLWNRDKGTGEFNVKNPAGEIVYWARGNTWVIAALAKQLMYLDKEAYPEIYAQYEKDFKDMSAAIKDLQREDGTWNAAMQGWQGNDGKEITGTAGFLYALATGISLGILPVDEYLPTVEKAYKAISETCVIKNDEDGIKVGYMQPVGKRCDTYKNETYSTNHTNTFGTGLVLMGASAYLRLLKDYKYPTILNTPEGQKSVIKTIDNSAK